MTMDIQPRKQRGNRRSIYVDPIAWLEVQRVAYQRNWTVSRVIRYVIDENIGRYVEPPQEATRVEGEE